ncbi:MAG: AAA family ATPase [Candidatus Moraniibacteriota bacterium]
MKKILITGISGSGKSTLCKTLQKLGEEAYSIEEDFDGMFAMYRKGTNEIFDDFDNADPAKIDASEWRCSVERLKGLIATQKNERTFYCGVASNMDDILPLFDKVFLLKASPDVLRGRLSNREGTEDMGGTEESRQAVLGWKDWWEETMEDKGAVTIDANHNSDEVAREIISLTE